MTDLIIVGVGISGAALAKVFAKYTNVKHIVILDKYGAIAQVASRGDHNSQTLHTGDIETNINGEKRYKVQKEAGYLEKMLEMYGEEGKHFLRTQKMLLAVGKEEVADIRQRYSEIKQFYPKLRLIEKHEIADYEPAVMEGRSEDVEMAAFVTEGLTVDFGAVAELFIDLARKNIRVDLDLGVEVHDITRMDDGTYAVNTSKGVYYTKSVAVMAGAYSLAFAKKLGYGKHLEILPVSGDFYVIFRKMLRGKIYRRQLPGLPMAEIHADIDILDPNSSRLGPIAIATIFFEKYKIKSMSGFFRSVVWSFRGLWTFVLVATNLLLLKFILKNVPYYIPYFGKYFFVKKARIIFPSIKARDLHYVRSKGNIRAQVANTLTMKLEMGECIIYGTGDDKLVFNITPSPGASVCMGGAYVCAKKLIEVLGEGYTFYQDKWDEDMAEKPIKEKELV